MRLPDESLNAALQSVAKIDIDARRRIRLLPRCHPERMRRISQFTLGVNLVLRFWRDRPVFAGSFDFVSLRSG